MVDNEISDRTKEFCCRYLSSLADGPWMIHGACITARTETSYLVTADAQVVRLLIEKPQDWAVAFEIAQRDGTIQRIRAEGYDCGANTCAADEVQGSYLRWLDSL